MSPFPGDSFFRPSGPVFQCRFAAFDRVGGLAPVLFGHPSVQRVPATRDTHTKENSDRRSFLAFGPGACRAVHNPSLPGSPTAPALRLLTGPDRRVGYSGWRCWRWIVVLRRRGADRCAIPATAFSATVDPVSGPRAAAFPVRGRWASCFRRRWSCYAAPGRADRRALAVHVSADHSGVLAAAGGVGSFSLSATAIAASVVLRPEYLPRSWAFPAVAGRRGCRWVRPSFTTHLFAIYLLCWLLADATARSSSAWPDRVPEPLEPMAGKLLFFL